MKNNLDLSKILKDCPEGMELDCLMYEDVYFDYVDELNIIHCYIQHETHRTSLTFNQHGTPNSDIKSKCVIFPKGKTSWEGFQRPFIDGDIVYLDFGYYYKITIFKKQYLDFLYYHASLMDNNILSVNTGNSDICMSNLKEIRFATEEEKLKLFQTIKDNGYKWNETTKTLEKLILPKFKVGDIVQDKDIYKVRITEVNVEDELYGYESIIASGIGGFSFNEQDNWELIPNKSNPNHLKRFDDMTRQEEIEQQAFAYYESCSDEDIAKQKAFIEGAKWADKTMIEKIEELFKDFIESIRL